MFAFEVPTYVDHGLDSRFACPWAVATDLPFILNVDKSIVLGLGQSQKSLETKFVYSCILEKEQ